MKTVFVVSEFNPFHYGHKYLISELKKQFDIVVCIMSGNSVQRGNIAVCDKYARAECAVRGGADLVIELPYPFSSLSAKDFASSSVYIANALSAEYIAFGAGESTETLSECADILINTPPDGYIGETGNVSYPKAVSNILHSHFADVSFIKMPNNILGIEYIKTIKENRFGITPIAVKRCADFHSSTEIRERIANGDGFVSLVPPETASVLGRGMRDGRRIDAALVGAMRLWNGREVYGADSGNLYRLRDIALECVKAEEICEKGANATVTKSSVRRTLLHNALGTGKEYGGKNGKKPTYALVLALNRNGREYIKANKKRFALPVLTKPAQLLRLSDEIKSDFTVSLRADSLFDLTDSNHVSALCRTPFVTEDNSL